MIAKYLIFILLTFGTFSGLKSQVIKKILKPDAKVGADAKVTNILDCSLSSPPSFADAHKTNYGNSYLLPLSQWTYSGRNCSEGTTRFFIRFDELICAGNNMRILKAYLKLYGFSEEDMTSNYGNSRHPGSPFDKSNSLMVGMPEESWDEHTITWDNMPEVSYSPHSTYPESTSRFEEIISIDVTEQVKQIFSSRINNGFALRLKTETPYRSWYFASSDFHKSFYHPELILEMEVFENMKPAGLGQYDNIVEKCENESISIGPVNSPSSLEYSWSNGQKGPRIEVNHQGNYILTVSDSCLYYMDTILVKNIQCSKAIVEIPNFFSPNGDGSNDVFYIHLENIYFIDYYIYNRWGKEVYHSTQADNWWDGTISGKNASEGVYYISLTARDHYGDEYQERKMLHLIR